MGSLIFVIIACCFSLLLILIRLKQQPLQIKLLIGGALAATLFSFVLPVMFPEISAELTGWSRILSISLILTILSVLIRELKPAYTRYPVKFVYLPMIILVVYPFIHQAEIIDNMLNILLQGGALLVISLLFGSVKKKISNPYIFLAGIVLMIVSYLFYWFIPDIIQDQIPWLWMICFATGIIVLSFNITEIIQTIIPAKI